MSQGGVPGSGPNQDNVRASDEDRERIVEQLRRHASDGRLTMDEFEERMSAAYEARTYGELAELTRDLPVDLGASGTGWPGSGRSQADRSRPGQSQPGQSWPGRGSQSSAAPLDIAAVVASAAMDWRASRHELRHQLRTQMHNQVRQQRRQGDLSWRGGSGTGLAALTAGWAGLSVLLTGVWVIAGIADHGYFGDFWPAWPIGILGLLTVTRYMRFFGHRH
jgi:hypothetical protein